MKTNKIRLSILLAILVALCVIFVVRRVTEEEPPENISTAPGAEEYLGCSKFDFLKNMNAVKTKGQIDPENVKARYLTLGGDKRRCLYYPIMKDDLESVEVIFSDIEAGDMSRLTFGVGVNPKDKFARKGKIRFQAFIVDKGDKRKVFEKTLRPRKMDVDGEWFDFNIDISRFSNKVIDVIFAVTLLDRSGTNVGAFWAEPLLHNLPYDDDWPNIIFISIDTLRADHLGCYGYRRDISPNIDEFARDGVRYKYCVSQAPYTLISYSSMFTSLYPNRILMHHELRNECLTMAEILSALGYYTISFNGGNLVSRDFGMDQGFRVFKSYPHNVIIENDIVWEYTGAMNALKMEEHKKRKFFMFIHTYEVHCLYDAPETYKKKVLRREGYFSSGNRFLLRGDIKGYTGGFGWGFRNDSNRYKQIPTGDKDFFIDTYDAEIIYTDAWLGRLFDFLKEEGLYDDTLIIFNSDHGEEFYEHSGWTHSHQLYGELINVPLIIKYPKMEKRGIEAKRVARSVDILPTILHDILGLNIESFNFDGVPLSMPLGDSRTLSFQFRGRYLKKIAIFQDEYKLIRNFAKHDESEPDRPEKELFLYRVDRGDTNSVGSMHEEKVEHLNTLVTKEFDLYMKKLEHSGSVDFFEGLDEGAIEKLKDLGYVE